MVERIDLEAPFQCSKKNCLKKVVSFPLPASSFYHSFFFFFFCITEIKKVSRLDKVLGPPVAYQ